LLLLDVDINLFPSVASSSRALSWSEVQDGSSYTPNRDKFNFYERAILRGLEPTYSVTVVFSSRIESAHRCTSVVPINAPLKSSTPLASRDENSAWV
jgi:hypothetical protein